MLKKLKFPKWNGKEKRGGAQGVDINVSQRRLLDSQTGVGYSMGTSNYSDLITNANPSSSSINPISCSTDLQHPSPFQDREDDEEAGGGARGGEGGGREEGGEGEGVLEGEGRDEEGGGEGVVENPTKPPSPAGALYTEIRLIEHAREWEATGAKSVPPDFICPLSLDIMVDPVVIASGQTYERAYIERWLAGGHKTCPKTNQELPHTNVVPNEAAKAVIREWCATHGVVLPETVDVREEAVARAVAARRSERDELGEHMQGGGYGGGLLARRNQYRGLRVEGFRRQMERQAVVLFGGSVESSATSSPITPAVVVAAVLESGGELGRQSSSDGRAVSERGEGEAAGGRDEGDMEENLTTTTTELLANRTTDLMTSTTDLSECNFTGMSLCSDNLPLTTTSMSIQGVAIDEGEESSRRKRRSNRNKEEPVNHQEIRNLLHGAQSESEPVRRRSTEGLRRISKISRISRIVLAEMGAIPILVDLLDSVDEETAEYAVTSLVNLSLETELRRQIAGGGAVIPLVRLLESAESLVLRENALSTLCNLSSVEPFREELSSAGLIPLLLDILGADETFSVRQEASMALFNLALNAECRAAVVSAGGVELVLELMGEDDGELEEDLVMLLCALLRSPLGRSKVQLLEGVPVLASIAEGGSEGAQTHAVAALLLVASGSEMGREMVRNEITIPSLVAISEGGTARGKSKALALLQLMRRK